MTMTGTVIPAKAGIPEGEKLQRSSPAETPAFAGVTEGKP